jgi:hypothetical protein
MLLLVCWVLGLASSCASDEQQGSERPSEEGPPAAAAETTPEEARPAARESGETIAEPTDPPEGTTPATSSSDLAGLLAEEEDGGAGASDGYVAVTDGAGALSVEVPLGWDHATGEESETGEGGRSWSDFAGEGHKASITAAPTLDAWHTAGGVPGIYVVASKGLARGYTDEQLVASGPFDLSATCEPGARSDFERGPYTGRMQAWRNCEVGAAATFLTLSAAPEGRECVVLMQLAMYGEADVEVGQRILDAFEVECAAAASG